MNADLIPGKALDPAVNHALSALISVPLPFDLQARKPLDADLTPEKALVPDCKSCPFSANQRPIGLDLQTKKTPERR